MNEITEMKIDIESMVEEKKTLTKRGQTVFARKSRGRRHKETHGVRNEPMRSIAKKRPKDGPKWQKEFELVSVAVRKKKLAASFRQKRFYA